MVLDRHPLENLLNTTTLAFVMKNGRMYDASTLDEVYPRQVKVGTLPWEEPPPK